jgi:hypothetical protein
MEHYLGVAREEGLTEKQIGAVQAIVMAVSAGRVNAQLREVRACIAEKTRTHKAARGKTSC